MIKLAVLDMAGTTVRDEHEVEKCFKQACELTGLNLTDDEILAVQGWSKRFVFEYFWKRELGADHDEFAARVIHSYDMFKKILEQHYLSNLVVPTEGALEVFNYFKENNIHTVLTTGFYRKVTDIILEKLGWLDQLDENGIGKPGSFISMSIASDEVERGRPFPDMIHKAMEQFNITNPKGVIKLGDTPSDMKAGKAADCLLTIGLTNGTHSKEQMLQTEHDLLIGSLLELPNVLQDQNVLA